MRWLRRTWPLYDASIFVWLAVLAILIALVAAPLFELFRISLVDRNGFTMAHFVQAYGNTRHLQALLNSLLLGVASTVLCLAMGLPLAWAVARTDMPAKGLVRALVLGTFITPPYLGTIGWILLAGPNAGWLNKGWMGLTGAETGFLNIYSFPGLVFVVALYSFPYVFIFATAALELVSSEMEEAAQILGAGGMRTTFRVTLPLIVPSIAAASIVTFLEAIALFGTPALIAIPARINVVTTQLLQFFEFPISLGAAAAYAMPLLAVTAGLFWVQNRILARRGYVVVSGKGGARSPTKLGRMRWVALAACLGIVTLSLFLPYGVLTMAAFSKAWGLGVSLDNLTLRNFSYLLFTEAHAKRAIINSYTYSATAATLAIAIALLAAYGVRQRLIPFGNVISFLCTAPYVIPGMVLAIGFYAMYAPPPVGLYGTAALVILAFVARFLPIAYSNSLAALRGLHPEMEEAVRVLGGSRLTGIRRVIAPLLKRSLAGSWILVFILAVKELSTAIFLVSPGTQLMSVLTYNLSDEGKFEVLSALGLILTATTVIVVLLGMRLLGRDFMLRRD